MSAEGTERSQVGTGLSESEEQLQEIFSQTAVGIAVISLDGAWLRVNKRYCEMLGYPESELRTKRICDITHADDLDEVLAARRQLLAGEISSHTMEKRYIRKDGTVFWGRLNRSLVRDHHDRPKYFIAVVEDVTEKIQAERALRDSQQRLALAQSAAHLGAWDRDLRTNELSISGEYARLYGLTGDHLPLTYEEWLNLIHPDDRERIRQLVNDTLTRKRIWDTEFRVIWPDGSIHWLLGKGTAFHDDSGRAVRIAGVNLDITERKRAEEQRLRLAAIVESSEDAIFSKDLDGTIVSWNSGAEKLFGYTADEIVGKPISLLLPPDRVDEFPQILNRIRSGVSLPHHEATRLCKDSRRIEVSVTISPVRDSTGALVGSSSIVRDITERKKTEALLRESEERFRDMADAAPVMVWVSGPDKLCTFFNKPWLDFVGHKLQEELGNGWADSVHCDDLDRCTATYHSSFDARRSFQMEYRLRRADGEYRWILDNGVPLYRGAEFAGYIGSCIDITEQKVIEERLRASETRLIEAQRLAKIGSWERDIETDAIRCSEEMLQILGRPTEAPSDFAAFLNYVHVEDRRKIIDADYQTATKFTPVDVEYRIITPDGEIRFVRSTAQAIRNDEGVAVRIIGANQDITERIRSRQLFLRAQEESFNRQKLESLGVLARGIAHDFNNLLGGILVSAELILAQNASGSPVEAEELHRIRMAAIRGGEIAGQLLTFGGEESPALKPVDISQLVGEMLELLRVSISKRALLNANLASKLPCVRANAAQIRQVVMNLIINASESLGENEGVISVTVERVRAGLDDNPASPAQDWLRLEISDTGCGMTPEIQAKVFDPFFTTKFAGRGLGLALVQRIVRSLDGAIHITSEPGKGTTFRILLPGAETTAEATTILIPRTEQAPRAFQDATVLVVEDEDSLRQPVSKLMRSAGFSVIEASDGSAALEAIRAHESHIDILLLDITLPGIPSRKVFEEAKHLRPKMSLIVTSAYSRDVAEETLRGRIEQFIQKPYRIGDLVDLVRQTLS